MTSVGMTIEIKESRDMAEFVRICSKAELPWEGEAKEFETGDRQICVAMANGKLSAMNNLCPHRGGPLGQGLVEEGKIVCPWHAWTFDLATGVVVHSADARVMLYELKVEGEDVLVGLS
jgi:nitrite reductase (NADH) small subunit